MSSVFFLLCGVVSFVCNGVLIKGPARTVGPDSYNETVPGWTYEENAASSYQSKSNIMVSNEQYTNFIASPETSSILSYPVFDIFNHDDICHGGKYSQFNGCDESQLDLLVSSTKYIRVFDQTTQQWFEGTAVFIAPRLLITAGHNLYDNKGVPYKIVHVCDAFTKHPETNACFTISDSSHIINPRHFDKKLLADIAFIKLPNQYPESDKFVIPTTDPKLCINNAKVVLCGNVSPYIKECFTVSGSKVDNKGIREFYQIPTVPYELPSSRYLQCSVGELISVDDSIAVTLKHFKNAQLTVNDPLDITYDDIKAEIKVQSWHQRHSASVGFGMSGGGINVFGEESNLCFIQSMTENVVKDITSEWLITLPGPNVASKIDYNAISKYIPTLNLQKIEPNDYIRLTFISLDGKETKQVLTFIVDLFRNSVKKAVDALLNECKIWETTKISHAKSHLLIPRAICSSNMVFEKGLLRHNYRGLVSIDHDFIRIGIKYFESDATIVGKVRGDASRLKLPNLHNFALSHCCHYEDCETK